MSTLGLQEAAKILRLAPSTLRKRAAAGKVPAVAHWTAVALLLIVLGLPACAWRPEIIAEESVQQAAQVVDLDQTLDLRHTRHCVYGPAQQEGTAWSGLHEVRPYLCGPPDVESMAAPFIGRHPSDARVYQFKAAEMALHAGVTQLLVSGHWRTATRVWEAVTIGVQGAVDVHNERLGVGLRYKF